MLRILFGSVITISALFAAANDAEATLFSGTATYVNGSGPVVSTNSPVAFSADLMAGESQSFPDFLTYSTPTTNGNGAGTGTVQFSFTSPTAQTGSISVTTEVVSVLIPVPPLCVSAGGQQICSNLPPLASGFGAIAPLSALDVSFGDGSKLRVSLTTAQLGGGGTATGRSTLTLTDLADAPSAPATSVVEPGSIALLAGSMGLLGIRRRRRQG